MTLPEIGLLFVSTGDSAGFFKIYKSKHNIFSLNKTAICMKKDLENLLQTIDKRHFLLLCS